MESKEIGVDKRRRLIPGEAKAKRARAWETVGHACGHAKSLQSCPTLCNPMDCSPPGSSLHGYLSPDKNTGVGCQSLLQVIFLTQGSNLGLLHCRQIPYSLYHQGTLKIPRFSISSSSLFGSETLNNSVG